MTRYLLLLALLALPLTGCPPSLGDDDDAAVDDDDSMDDDDAVDDDDSMDDDDAVDDDDVVDDDDDNTTDPVDDDDSRPDDDDVVDDDDDISGPTPIEFCDQTTGNDFELGAWSITGDILDAIVSYSGGCEVHDFRACWDTLFLESNPVQANLIIRDLGPPDACLAFITEQVQFDLQLLQDAWIQSYGPAPGEIIVNIDGGSDSYTF